MSEHYQEPGWFTRNVFNRAVRALTRVGLSVMGSRELRVRGRSSGEWRSVPVNLLTVDGVQYLVAARGVTQWVRNMRVAGGGELRLGRRTTPFTATEVADEDTVPVLRAYLKRWAWEVGTFFDGVDAKSTDDELAAISPDHPVFRVAAA
jgi:deazaflavin-dependent oxidoreductase (nitroreductase family)